MQVCEEYMNLLLSGLSLTSLSTYNDLFVFVQKKNNMLLCTTRLNASEGIDKMAAILYTYYCYHLN